MEKANIKFIKDVIIEDEDQHVSDRIIKTGTILHNCEKVLQDDRDWLFITTDEYKPSIHYKKSVKGIDLYLNQNEVEEI